MKKFYKNLFCFIFFLLLLLLGLDFLSTRGYTRVLLAQLTDSEGYGMGGPEDVVPLIYRARKNDGTTKLILGDSFANQTLNDLHEYNPDYAIMTSNAAVTMAGQYVIAKEYLDNHPDATDVYLFVLPESIGRTFDTKWGYQYAVLPFIITGTLTDFEDDTLRIFEDTYGELYMNSTFAKLVEKSDVNRKISLNSLKSRTEGYELHYFYELSDIYMTKLADLCKENGAEFHLYPCPVSEEKREEVDKIAIDYPKSDTYRVNPYYFDRVFYYPADWSGDGAHLLYEYRDKEYIYPMFREIIDDREFLAKFSFG